MEESKVQISPTCHFELVEYETFPATLTLDYTEHSPAHGYSDTDTSVDISKEQAAEIVKLLQKFTGAESAHDAIAAELKQEKVENLALRKALERVANEKFPHPPPCRETYLRRIAKAALAAKE